MKKQALVIMTALAALTALCSTNNVDAISADMPTEITVITNADGSVTISGPYTNENWPECREIGFTVETKRSQPPKSEEQIALKQEQLKRGESPAGKTTRGVARKPLRRKPIKKEVEQ